MTSEWALDRRASSKSFGQRTFCVIAIQIQAEAEIKLARILLPHHDLHTMEPC